MKLILNPRRIVLVAERHGSPPERGKDFVDRSVAHGVGDRSMAQVVLKAPFIHAFARLPAPELAGPFAITGQFG